MSPKLSTNLSKETAFFWSFLIFGQYQLKNVHLEKLQKEGGEMKYRSTKYKSSSFHTFFQLKYEKWKYP